MKLLNVLSSFDWENFFNPPAKFGKETDKYYLKKLKKIEVEYEVKLKEIQRRLQVVKSQIKELEE